MKLSKFCELISTPICIANIFDIFTKLNVLEVKELEVNKAEMFLLVNYFLANINNDSKGNSGKILSEGKIDKFIGIKLTLK